MISVNKVVLSKLQLQVEQYREVALRKSDLERTDLQKEKTGVFSGSYAVNPANGEVIPIWVADYVLGRFIWTYSLYIKYFFLEKLIPNISIFRPHFYANGPKDIFMSSCTNETCLVIPSRSLTF